MPFSDLALSRRLEHAEGRACVEFAQARQRLFPDRGTEWMECAGACAVFDGIDSPITQTFGLGIFEELNEASLDQIEHFFFSRGAHVDHEVSPLAGIGALGLLCARGYRPIEISSVLYRPVEDPVEQLPDNVKVRVAAANEAELWADVSARGWGHGNPELSASMKEFGAISFGRENGVCFLAEINGQAGAAGALSIHEGIALFAGGATIPELRRRGLQGALLSERLRYARAHGCDLAMMVAEAGSESQRNAERKGFRIAYTRMKWRLLRL
jgi:GNAT superfamily N-acetyltransferase